MPLTDRPTGDLVILIITGTVAAAILLGGVGAVILAALHGWDAGPALTGLGNAVTAMLAAILGYLAGRGRGAQP